MVKFKDKTSADVQKHKSIWVAEEFWREHQDIIYCNSTFWHWGGQVYHKIDDIDFMIIMSKRFPAFDEMRPSQQKEVMEVYKRSGKVNQDKFNSLDGLCFKNVYFCLSSLNSFPHDKSRINTILLPYDYNAEAQCPIWQEKLNEILEGDINKIKTIQEFFGYCLTRQTKYHKALFLIGEGATGKSTVLDVLAAMVGQENVCTLSPRYYRDSMRVSAIENKLVLMSHEISKNIEDYEAEFRDIVTSAMLNVHTKYIKPYDFRPFCKIVWAMNEIPYINDHTSAFYRRILPIEFNNQIVEENQDRELIEKLRTELPGILNWALEGLKRLRERGGFFRDVYMKEHIEEMRLQNNPIATWAKENIKIAFGEELLKQEVYQKYSAWCGLNGHKSTSNAKFGFEFYRIYKATTKKDMRRGSGERERIWPNLTWITSENRTQEQKIWEE